MRYNRGGSERGKGGREERTLKRRGKESESVMMEELTKSGTKVKGKERKGEPWREGGMARERTRGETEGTHQ